MRWIILKEGTNLGFLPSFIREDDPRPAAEQINERYQFGGWRPMKGFTMEGTVLHYPGDPPMYPLAISKIREETIILYKSDWVAIVQPDDSFEVSRVD